MECILGNPLSDEDLLSAIDNEAPPGVIDHLARCGYCAKQRDRLARFEARLQAAAAHPSRQLLLEYEFNLLGADDARAIERHLDTCTECQALLSAYHAEIAPPQKRAVRRAPSRTPAADWLRGSFFRPLSALASSVASLGTLGDDGVIVSNTDGTSLFLKIETENERYTVGGQIVADDQAAWTDAVASLSADESLVSVTLLNQNGQFRFEGLHAGSYRLRITSVGGVVAIFDALTIG